MKKKKKIRQEGKTNDEGVSAHVSGVRWGVGVEFYTQ